MLSSYHTSSGRGHDSDGINQHLLPIIISINYCFMDCILEYLSCFDEFSLNERKLKLWIMRRNASFFFLFPFCLLLDRFGSSEIPPILKSENSNKVICNVVIYLINYLIQ